VVIAIAEIERRDAIKNGFEEEHGYRLVRIPFFDYDRIDTILLEQLTATVSQKDGGKDNGSRCFCSGR
jgi:hypothetical protein